jgi:hypothetical protein
VRFIDAHGDVVVARDRHSSFSVYAEPPARTLTLAAGAVAAFGFGWPGNPVNGQRCVAVTLADVRLETGVGQLSVTLPLDPPPCAGGISVTPLEAGAWPQRSG